VSGTGCNATRGAPQSLDTRNVFSPLSSDLPVGQFLDKAVESYF
jgi:hypothetical protein